MILTIIFVVFLFSLLVIVHEWGHFIVARRNGVKVDEFGIGFPPRLAKIKKGGTLYTINALPLGGFVQLKGETGTKGAKDSFAAQKTWPKTKILLAGVAMNLLVAYLIMLYLAVVGFPQILPGQPPTILGVAPIESTSPGLTVYQVAPDSPAAKAGLKQSDAILSINGEKISTEEGLRNYTKAHAGQTVVVRVSSKGAEIEKSLTLGAEPNKGPLGVIAQPQTFVRYPLAVAPLAALAILGQMVLATLGAFGNMIRTLLTTAKVSENVTGPVGITVIFGQVSKFGYQYILILLASISLSLGIINALPLPALDGGRVFVVWLQALGVKITPKVEQMTHLIGFIALILLGIIVAVSDVSRFIR